MKQFIACLLTLMWVGGVHGQHLKIHKERKLLYIQHKVAARETLYSLARMYHLSPKEIATANGIELQTSLRLGQQLRVPLTKDNFIQKDPRKAKEYKAVYHTIRKGDNLYDISRLYQQVSEKQLKAWNKVGKNIQPGKDLIVGYVRYTPQSLDYGNPETKEIASAEERIPAKITATDSPKAASVAQQPSGSVAVPVEKKNTVGQVVHTPAKRDDAVMPTASAETDEGFFANEYVIGTAGAMQKQLNGTAATFKSTSGWTDRKYYLLINDTAPETIVRVTFNGRVIYAKVLESLPSLRENNGLLCRLSNAAAAALGITDPKFTLEISYAE